MIQQNYRLKYFFFSRNKTDVEETIRIIYETLFGKLNKKTKIERKMMLNGMTLPIKINLLEDELITETIYIKKPDTNRLIGWFFYNLIQNEQKTIFGYNEKIFVEQEVRGHTLLQEDEELFLVLQEYKIGAGKAAAQAEFLGLYGDVVAERNRIVDDRYNTLLFDFDAILEPMEIGTRGNYLIKHYLEQKQADRQMIEAYRNEKKTIAKKVSQNKNLILEFAKCANVLKDQDYGTIKDKVFAFSGHRCLKDYIVSQTRLFSQ